MQNFGEEKRNFQVSSSVMRNRDRKYHPKIYNPSCKPKRKNERELE